MSAPEFHPEALADLVRIQRFVAEDSVEAADKTLQKILEKVRQLALMPHIGHTRRDVTKKPVRFANVYDYLIVYLPDQEPIFVVAVFHGRRSPHVLATLLRERKQ